MTLAYSMALIFPSWPLFPKPPGTTIPLHCLINFQLSCSEDSRLVLSIQMISNFQLQATHACCKAVMSEKYVSLAFLFPSVVYLPTIATLTVYFSLVIDCKLCYLNACLFQTERSGFSQFIFNFWQIK